MLKRSARFLPQTRTNHLLLRTCFSIYFSTIISCIPKEKREKKVWPTSSKTSITLHQQISEHPPPRVDRLESALSTTVDMRVLFSSSDDSFNKETYKLFNQYLSRRDSLNIIKHAITSVKIQDSGISEVQITLSREKKSVLHRSITHKKQLVLEINTSLEATSIDNFFASLDFSQYVFDLERSTDGCDLSFETRSGGGRRKITEALQPSIRLLNNLDCSSFNVERLQFKLSPQTTGHKKIKGSSGLRIEVNATLGPESIRKFLSGQFCQASGTQTNTPGCITPPTIRHFAH